MERKKSFKVGSKYIRKWTEKYQKSDHFKKRIEWALTLYFRFPRFVYLHVPTFIGLVAKPIDCEENEEGSEKQKGSGEEIGGGDGEGRGGGVAGGCGGRT